MAKRFTASDKWKDNWFSGLNAKQKLFWLYILDECNNAGIWEKNFRLASFQIGEEITEEECLQFLGNKVVPIGDDKLFIPKFILFQYGTLREDCKPHQAVIRELDRLGIDFTTLEPKKKKGYPKGINTLEDKDKDKDKEKDKDKDTEMAEIPNSLNVPEFIEAWKEFRQSRRSMKKPLTKLAEEKHFAYLARFPSDVAIAMVEQSVKNQWQGIFELKTNGNGKQANTTNGGSQYSRATYDAKSTSVESLKSLAETIAERRRERNQRAGLDTQQSGNGMGFG